MPEFEVYRGEDLDLIWIGSANGSDAWEAMNNFADGWDRAIDNNRYFLIEKGDLIGPFTQGMRYDAPTSPPEYDSRIGPGTGQVRGPIDAARTIPRGPDPTIIPAGGRREKEQEDLRRRLEQQARDFPEIDEIEQEYYRRNLPPDDDVGVLGG